jgi:DNA-binding beta-propeller fold protein YncE
MRYVIKAVALLVVVGFFACAPSTALIQRDAEGKIFWPGPPEKEKIKYLWSMSVVEVIGKGGKRGILDFILGDYEGDVSDPRSSNTLIRPFAVYVDDKKKLYVTDTAAMRVTVVDLNELKSFHITGKGSNELQMPVGVTVDSKGRIFVSDSKLGSVFVFGQDGKFIDRITGDFLRPTGIAIDKARDRLYIADTLGHTVYVYNTNGNMITSIGGSGSEVGQFNFPTHLWLDNSGYLYVTDSMNFRIQIFDSDGNFFKTVGTLGDAYVNLEKPKGVATDSDGHIYVVDSINDMVKIYNKEGLLLLFFGSEGLDYGQFWLPSGIFIDSNDIIYIADTYNMRVQAFQYLKD